MRINAQRLAPWIEQERIATADARNEQRRQATQKAFEDEKRRSTKEAAKATARAVATVKPSESEARKDFIPDLNATVTSLRFFEKARGEQVPAGKRTYTDRFKSSKTRAVYWEVQLKHPPLGQRRNFIIRSVCYGPSGEIFGQGELNTYVEANWGKSTHIYGWGFDKSGNFKSGKYRVELFIDDRKIGSGSFEIYSGLF